MAQKGRAASMVNTGLEACDTSEGRAFCSHRWPVKGENTAACQTGAVGLFSVSVSFPCENVNFLRGHGMLLVLISLLFVPVPSTAMNYNLHLLNFLLT